MHSLYIKTSLLVCILAFAFCDKPNTLQKTTASQAPVENSGMQAFLTNRFPNAQDIYWDTLETGYSATFYDGKNDYKAMFDSIGQFQQTTMLIELEALPAAINKYLKEKYKNPEIAIVQLVDDGTNKTYHIELQASTDYQMLDFDVSGKLLKESKAPLSNEELKQQEEEGVDDN
jgi:Putative beta-lactamase-inhibitor-like, PepSY-like